MSKLQAEAKLKQLQARIDGMRLALATSCTTCDVDAVVNLLKSINDELNVALGHLQQVVKETEEVKFVKPQEDTKPVEVEQQPDPNAYKQSEMYKEIENILDKAPQVDLKSVQTEDEKQYQQDMDALSSLMNFVDAQEKKAEDDFHSQFTNTSEIGRQAVDFPSAAPKEEIEKLDIRHLAKNPIKFDLPQANPEDFN